jgi:hypothetical protein
MIDDIVGFGGMAHQHDPRDAMHEAAATRALRHFLLAAFAAGSAGTGIELLLLEHFEEWRQLLPLAAIGAAIVVLAWHAVDRGPLSVRVLQGLMLIFALIGLLGLVFHYRGNAEFELEMYPSLAGFELVAKALTGATPALAPGAMILLALVGLGYTFNHPRLNAKRAG